MPFDKYLQAHDGQGTSPPSSYASFSNAAPVEPPSTTFAGTVQLQIPQFIYGGPPMLAPGGGAEVLPAATFNNSWFTNNGFTPRFSNDSLFPTLTQSADVIAGQQAALPHPPPIVRSPTAPSFDYGLLQSHPDTSVRQPPSSFPSLSEETLGAVKDIHHISVQSTQLSASVAAPPSLGLPVYSASGFDLLSILGRVVNRPNPKVFLGPVDLSCSFVVVDIRRHDRPIIYCSPTFCRLTGYEESEVIGRNCRFLQAPNGAVAKGEQRRFTSHEAVAHMRKALIADKEYQTSIVNYRKNGSAFINLVTIIPIAGGEHGLPHEENEVYYHVGFQVDLNEQPNAILQKLRDGSYMVNYSSTSGSPQIAYPTRERRAHTLPQPLIAKSLRSMLVDSSFTDSIPLYTSTVVPSPATEKSESHDPHQLLHHLLLTASPDFILVVSLKGVFLYVAPAVRRVLGYEPEELLGKSITDYCYPQDIVPLTRELKESSATPGICNDPPHHNSHNSSMPRTVDLLFRARTSTGSYVWVECRGRLHVEPGKGRKAIILSGRARGMAIMPWSDVTQGGGLNTSIRNTRAISKPEDEGLQVEVVEAEREFWGSLSKEGIILVAGYGVKDLLGWSSQELLGSPLSSIVAAGDEQTLSLVTEELNKMHSRLATPRFEPRSIYCRMRRKDGGLADVRLVLYQPEDNLDRDSKPKMFIPPPPILYQIKLIDGLPSNVQASGQLCHGSSSNIFDELQTSRGSWQYELQQLKYANQTLAEEIGLLEAQQMQVQQQSQAREHMRRISDSLPSTLYDSRRNSLPTASKSGVGGEWYGYGVKRGWNSGE